MAHTWQPKERHRKVRDAIAEMFEVEPHLMPSANRRAPISALRQASFWLVDKVFADLSYAMIGQLYGGRDHSTVIHGIRKVEARREADPKFAALLDAMLAAIGIPPTLDSPDLDRIADVALSRLPDHERGDDFGRLFKRSAQPDDVTRAIVADVEADRTPLKVVG
tara:strand:- start:546 stop:1040 length:495 start_codon:yes stop_codon:yes gene_type:complete